MWTLSSIHKPPATWRAPTLTLLFTSTALQSVLRRGWDLLKLRFMFRGCSLKKKKRKKVQPLLPAQRGALVPVSPLVNPLCFVPVSDELSCISAFGPPGGFSFRSSLVEVRGLCARTGAEQLAAMTWECELSFGMTSALLKKWNPVRHSCAARNIQLLLAH